MVGFEKSVSETARSGIDLGIECIFSKRIIKNNVLRGYRFQATCPRFQATSRRFEATFIRFEATTYRF
jgi:hypothetical protein